MHCVRPMYQPFFDNPKERLAKKGVLRQPQAVFYFLLIYDNKNKKILLYNIRNIV